MKKYKFVIVFLLIASAVFSKVKVNSSEKNYLNESIWSQVFNDFEGSLTIPVFTPWVFGVVNINYIKSNAFTKDILKEHDVFSCKDLIFREVTNSVNTSFVNYIPKDSTMRIRAIYKNRILYNYEVSQTDTTRQVELNLPSKNSGETIVFDKNERLLSFNTFNNMGTTTINNQKLSDSLSVCTTSKSESSSNVIEKRQFKNGLMVRKTTLKKDKLSSKDSFESDIIYKYDTDSKLICQLFLNRKGKGTDSIIYYYDSQDRIHMLFQHGEKEANKRIVYDYGTIDTVIKRFNPQDYSYTISYISSDNKLQQITINESVSSENDVFEFEYNAQGLLMTVSKLSKNIAAPNKQFIFGYNQNNNINKVKVINSGGTITKEINFEYDYL